MVYKPPHTALALRQSLETLLAPELGRFSNGKVSVWIDPPRIPPDLSSAGLLCRISRYGILNKSEHSHSTEQALQNYDWQVYLVQYDASSEGLRKMDIAKEKMEKAFPRQKQRVLESVSAAYPQIRFLLNFSQYINTRT